MECNKIREFMHSKRRERAAANRGARLKEKAERDRVRKALENVRKQARERRSPCLKVFSSSANVIDETYRQGRKHSGKDSQLMPDVVLDSVDSVFVETPPQTPLPSVTSGYNRQNSRCMGDLRSVKIQHNHQNSDEQLCHINDAIADQETDKTEFLKVEKLSSEDTNGNHHALLSHKTDLELSRRNWELEPLREALNRLVAKNDTIQLPGNPFKVGTSLQRILYEENKSFHPLGRQNLNLEEILSLDKDKSMKVDNEVASIFCAPSGIWKREAYSRENIHDAVCEEAGLHSKQAKTSEIPNNHIDAFYEPLDKKILDTPLLDNSASGRLNEHEANLETNLDLPLMRKESGDNSEYNYANSSLDNSGIEKSSAKCPETGLSSNNYNHSKENLSDRISDEDDEEYQSSFMSED